MYEALREKHGCKPCYIVIEDIPSKLILKKITELCNKLMIENEEEDDDEQEVQQDVGDQVEGKVSPVKGPDAKELRDTKAQTPSQESSDSNAAITAFESEDDDLCPKSSPESFGSDPATPRDFVVNGLLVQGSKSCLTNNSNELLGTCLVSSSLTSKCEQSLTPSSILKKTNPVSDTPLTRGAVQTSANEISSNRKKSVKFDVPPIDYVAKYKLKELEIEVDFLSEDFIRRATKGEVNWKLFFGNPIVPSEPEYRETDEASDEDFGKDYEPEDEEDEDEEPEVEEEEDTDSKKKKSKSGTSKKNQSSSKKRYVKEKEEGSKVKRVGKKKAVIMHHCDSCSFSTTSVRDLREHVMKHGVELDTMKCDACSVESFTVLDHERHVYECHEGPLKLPRVVSITCKTCQQIFTEEKEFDFHIINHIIPLGIGFKCTLCSSSYNKHSTAISHVKSHVNYKCTFCDRSFNTLDQVEKHCSQSHRNFGRPFNCNLCEFRSAVFGLLVKHRFDIHAIVTEEGKEKCRFCEAKFIFSSFEVMINHFAQHANNFHLYKCRECDFTADDTSKFHDHGMESHISVMITDEEIWQGPDITGLVTALSPVIRRRFGKIAKKSVVRTKPTFEETQVAVAGIMAGVGGELGVVPPIEPQTLSVFLANFPSSPIKNYSPQRPKRKSFTKASRKLKQDALMQQATKAKSQLKMHSKVDLLLQPDTSLLLNRTSPNPDSPLDQESSLPTITTGEVTTVTQSQILNNDAFLNDQHSASFETKYDEVKKHVLVNGKSFPLLSSMIILTFLFLLIDL